MLERFAVSIAASTILAILGKLGLLYYSAQGAGRDWLDEAVLQSDLVVLLLALFLIFLRGKMMHDDAAFFGDLAKVGQPVFKRDKVSMRLIRLGLFLGYTSWLLWAPAIYFLERPRRFAAFFVASIVLSTIWLVIDIVTRVKIDWRRAFWVIPNICYALLAALMLVEGWSTIAALGLIAVLVVDWLVSDPTTGHFGAAA
ncbi:MAG: hypothetical protein E6Q50_02980 [Lysobacter sp.]|nr:MAG: hypothetical protein E6Q50_02980 [Lysobacter sp.]